MSRSGLTFYGRHRSQAGPACRALLWLQFWRCRFGFVPELIIILSASIALVCCIMITFLFRTITLCPVLPDPLGDDPGCCFCLLSGAVCSPAGRWHSCNSGISLYFPLLLVSLCPQSNACLFPALFLRLIGGDSNFCGQTGAGEFEVLLSFFFFKARNPLFLFPLHHPDKALLWAWPREGRRCCVPCTSRVLSAPASSAMVTKKEQPLLLCHCQEILRSPVKSWECVWRLGDQWL